MTEPHPQPKCHGYACRVFEECADRYDDDEFPPCASHSSAVSERDKQVHQTLELLIKRLKEANEDDPADWTLQQILYQIEQVRTELRSQKGR